MSNDYKQAWEEAIIKKYGSIEAYKKLVSERSKKYGFQRGNVPKNKIQDDLADLPISRQKKYLLRKAKNETSL